MLTICEDLHLTMEARDGNNDGIVVSLPLGCGV